MARLFLMLFAQDFTRGDCRRNACSRIKDILVVLICQGCMFFCGLEKHPMPSPEVVEEALEKWILNLGCSRPIFILLNTIRFFFPLAFQRAYSNLFYCKNLRSYTLKRMRAVENNGSAFLHALDSLKHITQFLGL